MRHAFSKRSRFLYWLSRHSRTRWSPVEERVSRLSAPPPRDDASGRLPDEAASDDGAWGRPSGGKKFFERPLARNILRVHSRADASHDGPRRGPGIVFTREGSSSLMAPSSAMKPTQASAPTVNNPAAKGEARASRHANARALQVTAKTK